MSTDKDTFHVSVCWTCCHMSLLGNQDTVYIEYASHILREMSSLQPQLKGQKVTTISAKEDPKLLLYFTLSGSTRQVEAVLRLIGENPITRDLEASVLRVDKTH